MATLPTATIDQIWAQIMSELSRSHTEIAVSKTKLRVGIVNIDTELESAEVSILQNISDADVKSWLQTNQTIGRRVIELVATERRKGL